MSVNKHIIVSLIALLPACSGGALTQGNNTITVSSDPSGALVYVMGKGWVSHRLVLTWLLCTR